MSEHKLSTYEIVTILVILALLVMFLLSGCVLYRHDIEPDRESKTFWTLMKDISVVVDPNSGITYTSTSNKLKVISPYGWGETK